MSVEDYNKKQEQSGIKVGDYVKVLRAAYSYEQNWDNVWNSLMDKAVGSTYKVLAIHEGIGIRLESVKHIGANLSFPYFVLEKVNIVSQAGNADPRNYKRNSVEEASVGPQDTTGSKFISHYPHQCPKCNAPAYINFFDQVDCSREGCDGKKKSCS